MKKIKLIGVLIVIITLSIIAGCSSISIRTAIEIDAARENVYAALADIKCYPEWNPYHTQIEGEFKEGAALVVYVKRPDGQEVEVPPHMIRIVEHEEITWGGGIKGIFYGVHSFLLETKDNDKTLLKHNEDFSGIAIQFADLPPDVIADGYHQMNIALKKYVESQKVNKHRPIESGCSS